jgi:hypothetical protein
MIATRPTTGTVAARDIGIIYAMRFPKQAPSMEYLRANLVGFDSYSKAHQRNLLVAARMGADGSWRP